MKVGDRVIVATKRWDNNGGYKQSGLTGIITKENNIDCDMKQWLTVTYDHGQAFGITYNNYERIDLDYTDLRPAIMVDPEFGLEELETAENIIAQMG